MIYIELPLLLINLLFFFFGCMTYYFIHFFTIIYREERELKLLNKSHPNFVMDYLSFKESMITKEKSK